MRLKLILISIFVFATSSAFANKGIVLVYEIDYLSDRSPNAKVLQTAGKGDLVYIHPRYFLNSPLKKRYEKISDIDLDSLESGPADEGFYETLDRNGNIAWLPKKYVKLIFKDDREARTNISPYNEDKWDPTDYRIEEPLPPDYPLIVGDKRRAFITAGFGPTPKTNYPYLDLIDNEETVNRLGLTMTYLKKVSWDKFDRFYFGGTGHIYTSGARYTLLNGTTSEESRGNFGAGPYISYDVYRSEEHKFTVGGAFTLNYERFLVSQGNSVGDEQRSFSSLTFTPKISPFFSFREIIAGTDLIVGMEMQLMMGHYLKSDTPGTIDGLWQDQGDSDRIFVPFGGNTTFFIGVQSHY